MSTIDNTASVIEQYKNDDNLSARIRLHAKHSTNKQGLIPWLFSKYEFSDCKRILELGCGNGEQWANRIQQLPSECILVLSDLSEGMVKTVWERYSDHKSLLVQSVDIQNIPFPDNCFDAVIANHMLYHIPELSKALSEVNRILRSKGKFYASTNGNGGMRPFLRNAFKQVNPEADFFTKTYSFSLQNGSDILSEYFEDVQRHDYTDSLSVTDTHDLMDWLKSTISMSAYSEKDLEGLFEYFESIRLREGSIIIPKEAGLFIASTQ